MRAVISAFGCRKWIEMVNSSEESAFARRNWFERRQSCWVLATKHVRLSWTQGKIFVETPRTDKSVHRCFAKCEYWLQKKTETKKTREKNPLLTLIDSCASEKCFWSHSSGKEKNSDWRQTNTTKKIQIKKEFRRGELKTKNELFSVREKYVENIKSVCETLLACDCVFCIYIYAHVCACTIVHAYASESMPVVVCVHGKIKWRNNRMIVSTKYRIITKTIL